MIRHLLVHGGRSKHAEARRLRTYLYSKNCSQVLLLGAFCFADDFFGRGQKTNDRE
jgi:hypothetical protein